MKLKKLHLQNVCGYKEADFDFTYDNRNTLHRLLGQPENRDIKNLAVLHGPNGSGKCLTGSQYIITENGMHPISDLFINKKLEPDTWYKEERKICANGDWHDVNKIYYNGRQKTRKITTSHGYNIEGCHDTHQVLALKNGIIDFVHLSDLNEGDYICISRKGQFNSIDSISHNEAYILGYMVAEGTTCSDQYKFHNSDKEIIDHFQNCCSNFQAISSIDRNRSTNIVYLNTSFTNKLQDLGLLYGKSGEKTIPISVLQSSKEINSIFLRAYFEGDGGIDGDSISCSSISYELLNQIQLSLLRFGIVSCLRRKKVKLSYTDKYPNGYESWLLSIYGKDILKFNEEIGFISSRKIESLNNLIQKILNMQRNANKDIIPSDLVKSIRSDIFEYIDSLPAKSGRGRYFSRKDYKNTSNGLHCLQNNYLNTVKHGVSKDKFFNCLDTINDASDRDFISELSDSHQWVNSEFFFDTISNIEEGFEDLYDVCVDNVHQFWSNGFISHNSSALDVINIVSAPWRFVGRDVSMLFRKMIFHEDYDPGYEEYEPPTNVMRIEALFEDDHEVVIELDPDKIQLLQQGYIDHDEVGVLKNDLPRNPSQHAFYSDADNPANLQKFQINSECHDMFLDIAESVYGYKCELGKEVTEYDTESDSYVTFHTDFIITKPYGDDPIRVHYRRMSAGERKIATLLAQLCNPLQRNHYDIYLIDNVMMHIYTPRHTKMIDKMIEHFSNKQLMMTTHSTVALNHVKRKYGKRYLYDIEQYRRTGHW